MKIGFSLGRCVRDIVRGDIDIDSVAFIIAATDCRDTAGLVYIINAYLDRDDYLWGLDAVDCHRVASELWNSNKIIQPRRQGIHRHQQPANSVWVDLFPTQLSNNKSVKTAWDAYRCMLHMTENIETDAMEVFK
jgi:hypothetical protein